jgi:hypothetical protein
VRLVSSDATDPTDTRARLFHVAPGTMRMM